VKFRSIHAGGEHGQEKAIEPASSVICMSNWDKIGCLKNNEGRKIEIWHKPFEIDASDGHSGGG